MNQAEVKNFEDYYQSYTPDKLVNMLVSKDSGYRPETEQAIKNLITQKSGNVKSAIKSHFSNHTPEKLLEILTKQEQGYIPEVLEVIKSLLAEKEGSMDDFIKKEYGKSGETVLSVVKVKYIPASQNKQEITGDLFITIKYIFFVAKQIKTKAISSALIGGLIPELLDEWFNKKKVQNYQLPLTLQAKYTDGSAAVPFTEIKEARFGTKGRAVYIVTNTPATYHFYIDKENRDKIMNTLSGYGVRTARLSGVLGWIEDLCT